MVNVHFSSVISIDLKL